MAIISVNTQPVSNGIAPGSSSGVKGIFSTAFAVCFVSIIQKLIWHIYKFLKEYRV
jgi:hypothetical protein